ncbi:Uu.00g073720.m01.CDS01 [Anthostomella pinea]|uniref:Uu.00g073720.m01.CDS01 n=1 Tax=Anthostomella pinea TaxID=933095 RepID=A0AAI8YLK3_9PEZI|nr:Uu.00g073720.m01.CDS01 [Anthostomella pinea]
MDPGDVQPASAKPATWSHILSRPPSPAVSKSVTWSNILNQPPSPAKENTAARSGTRMTLRASRPGSTASRPGSAASSSASFYSPKKRSLSEKNLWPDKMEKTRKAVDIPLDKKQYTDLAWPQKTPTKFSYDWDPAYVAAGEDEYAQEKEALGNLPFATRDLLSGDTGNGFLHMLSLHQRNKGPCLSGLRAVVEAAAREGSAGTGSGNHSAAARLAAFNAGKLISDTSPDKKKRTPMFTHDHSICPNWLTMTEEPPHHPIDMDDEQKQMYDNAFTISLALDSYEVPLGHWPELPPGYFQFGIDGAFDGAHDEGGWMDGQKSQYPADQGDDYYTAKGQKGQYPADQGDDYYGDDDQEDLYTASGGSQEWYDAPPEAYYSGVTETGPTASDYNYKQLYHPNEIGYSSSKSWISPAEEERVRWGKLNANLHHGSMHKSPFVPRSLKKYVELKMATGRANEEAVEKQIAQREEQAAVTRRFIAAGGPLEQLQIPVEMSQKLKHVNERDGLSPITARPSIWAKDLGRNIHVDWPTYRELKADGDDRAMGRYGRFLPLPRVEVLDDKYEHLSHGPEAIPKKGPKVPKEYRKVANWAKSSPGADGLTALEAADLDKPAQEIEMGKLPPVAQELINETDEEES